MIGLYCRVSTQEQAVEGYSIGEQQERLRSFAASFGWRDVKMYVDPGFSGASLDRPALQELIRDVKKKKVSRVIVYKLDRLSRSQKDTLYLIEDVFLANGCEFISMSESFSTETPVGRATIGLLAVFAQLERETIKERLMVGRTARAKAGLYHGGGKEPAGYRFEGGRLVVDQDEAFQVREIFRLYASGLTIGQVRDQMAALGYLYKGEPWKRYHVKAVLHNPLYIGKVTFSGVEYDGSHEAIIDRETFDRAQALLASRAREYKETRSAHYAGEWLLLGLVWCPVCGSRITSAGSSRHGHHYDYYMCMSRRDKGAARIRGITCDAKPIRKEKLEEAVLGEIAKLAFDPDFKPKRKEAPDACRPLEAQIAKIDRQVSRLIDLYASGEFSADVLSEKAASLRETRQKLENRLLALKVENSSPSVQNVRKTLSGFSDAIEAGTPEQLKMIIRELIDRIEYADDDLVIRWKFE